MKLPKLDIKALILVLLAAALIYALHCAIGYNAHLRPHSNGVLYGSQTWDAPSIKPEAQP